MTYLITGSGTLATELIKQLYKQATKIVVYSRNEARQAELKKEFPEYPDNKMRYIIGDIRDLERLTNAMRGVDCCIHTAALKRIEVGEYDVEEFVKTNVTGSMNVIKACNSNNVKRCILSSTDKACSPINAYGASKLMAERLFISGNNLGSCEFAIVRYGNVLGSRGSVLELWQKQKDEGKPLTITSRDMTRFWIHIKDAAKFIIHKFGIMQAGCIYVPKIDKQSIYSLALTISDNIKQIDVRPSEKIHECLINEHEGKNTTQWEGYYIVYPEHHQWTAEIERMGSRVDGGFTLTSEE